MDYLGEALKLLPRPVWVLYTTFYLVFTACILLSWFNVSFPGQMYVMMIAIAGVMLSMGIAFIYGGVVEMRQAREEKRKPAFYKRAALYAGIACIVAACLLVYDFWAPSGIPETVGWIVTIACAAVIIVGLAPAFYHQVQDTNRAGKEALEKVQQEQEQQKLERESLQAEGKAVPEPEVNKARGRVLLALLLLIVVLFFGGMIGMIVNMITKTLPYEIFMLAMSGAWFGWSLFLIMISREKARKEQRSWGPWYVHASVIYMLTGVLFLAYFAAHYLLVAQYMLAKDTADKLNIIPFVLFVAIFVSNSVLTKRKEKVAGTTA
ncbi:hypothetical protein KDA_72810 [Dictyobacter alpinus]|uniref:Uncharacterized protein n=1 Tax=Dictyobacter alpinus TaxID=2014873 RepID=A0A402BKB1_9CHLR|nr:hypothetical protein [Dictyobacter alpinus]GCE31797.1 hypothetical protein KDA_72810 [Dictyobacter alpinus]